MTNYGKALHEGREVPVEMSDNLREYCELARRVDRFARDLDAVHLEDFRAGNGIFVGLAYSGIQCEITDMRKKIDKDYYESLFDVLEERLKKSYEDIPNKEPNPDLEFVF